MGKLKEKLLNNLTPEEMDEQYGISAFEYVEYMEKYKSKWQQLSLFDDNGDEIPEDVLEQIANEKQQLEKEFYYQSEIDDINDSVKLKYTDNDILYVLDGLVDPQKMDIIKDKLRDIWNTKNGILG
jgi:uncharacterized protein YnzC (UPF0291/DUF896 family)